MSDTSARLDRQAVVRQAIALLDTLDADTARHVLAPTRVRASLKADPDAFRAVLSDAVTSGDSVKLTSAYRAAMALRRSAEDIAAVGDLAEPTPAEVPVHGQPVTAGMLKAWLRDVPDSMPVIISRDDAGNTHAGLERYTEATSAPSGDLGFQDTLWDGETQDADLIDLIQAEGGQRVLVLIPQV